MSLKTKVNAISQQVVRPIVNIYYRLGQYRASHTPSKPVKWTPNQIFKLHPTLKLSYKLCVYPVALIFVLNLIVTIWAASTHSVKTGLTVTLFTADSTTIEWADFGFHLLINALSAILFAASSHMMQRLAAPTRQDIDNLHSRNRSVKIGSLAVSNFVLLDKYRLMAFALLWSTSLPIHLLFNSAIASTKTNAEWSKIVILLDGDVVPDSKVDVNVQLAGNRTHLGFPRKENGGFPSMLEMATYLEAQKPSLQRLSPSQCVEKYSSGQSPDWGDLLVVTTVRGQNNTFSAAWSLYEPSDGVPDWFDTNQGDSTCLARDGLYLPWSWMCGTQSRGAQLCPTPDLSDGRSTWAIENKTVDYCLARQLPPACELNLNLGVMIAVQTCVMGKLMAMVMAVFFGRHRPLVTIGDAVASFLEEEDQTTREICIAGSKHFPTIFSQDKTHYLIHPRESRRRPVALEMSWSYIWTTIFGIVFVGLAFGFFRWVYTQTVEGYAAGGFPFNFHAMWQLGLGVMPFRWSASIADRIMHYSGCDNESVSYIRGAVKANATHLGLSFFYLVVNNFFTRFAMALEFRSFNVQRRGLRVSAPVKASDQRETYFLQFPLRCSIPLAIYFILLHTILSQTIFIRRTLAIYPTSYTDSTAKALGRHIVSFIGYSPLAAFVFAILLTLLVILGLGIGAVTLDWILPSTTGDSRAISALCHTQLPFEENPEKAKQTDEEPQFDPGAKTLGSTPDAHQSQTHLENQTGLHLRKIRWGVTSVDLSGVGHCGFSLQPVRPPENGETIRP